MPKNKSPVSLQPHSDTELHSNQVVSKDSGSSVLNLKAENGSTLRLTSDQMEQWLVPVAKQVKQKNPALALKAVPNLNDPALAAWLVGLFGFKSPNDLIVFLKSPAGETVLEMIQEELIKMASLEEAQRRDFNNEEMRRRYMLAMLFLGLASQRDAKAKHLNALIQEQIDADLKRHHTANQDTPAKKSAQEVEAALNEAMIAYQHSAEAIKEKLDRELLALDQLMNQQTALDNKIAKLDQRHDTLNHYLDHVNDFLLMLSGNQPDPQRVAALQQQQAQLGQYIANRSSQNFIPGIASPFDQYSDAHLKARYTRSQAQLDNFNRFQSMDSIEQREQFVRDSLNQLSAMIFSRQNTMTTSIDNSGHFDDEEADEVHGMNLLAQHMSNVLSHISSGLRLVESNGKFYLIGADQSLSSMEEHDRQRAHQVFHDNINKNIAQNRDEVASSIQVERARYAKENEQNQRLVTTKQAAINLLKNKHSEIMAKHAEVANELQNHIATHGSAMAPVPKPTPTSTINPKPAATVNKTSSYRTILQGMQTNPTAQSLNALRAEIRNSGKPVEELQKELNKVKVGQPISPEMMQRLMQLDPEAQKRNPAPTPFSMKPKS